MHWVMIVSFGVCMYMVTDPIQVVHRTGSLCRLWIINMLPIVPCHLFWEPTWSKQSTASSSSQCGCA